MLDIFLLILAFILLGVIGGVLSGLLGVGGGLVVVPGLFFLFSLMHMPSDILMHMAAGTSLAVMIVTSARSLQAHLKRKVAFWPVYRKLVFGVIIGTVVGSIVAHWLKSQVLSLLFGLFVLVAAIRSWLGKEEEVSDKDLKRGLPNLWVMNAMGLLIGAKSGLLGVGGAAITIPFLTYCRIALREAVVVSAAVGVTVSIVGMFAFMANGWNVVDLPAHSLGYVYWPAWFPVAGATMITAPLGARLSHTLPVITLQKIFAIFMFIVALQLFYDSTTGW
jgi:uncharacterized protein